MHPICRLCSERHDLLWRCEVAAWFMEEMRVAGERVTLREVRRAQGGKTGNALRQARWRERHREEALRGQRERMGELRRRRG